MLITTSGSNTISSILLYPSEEVDEDKKQVNAKVHVRNKDANKLPSESILIPFVVLKMCSTYA